ncbi:hypothetical protein CAG70_06010 [Photobacterium halotolerans]|uniref:hypothetical protein n=1 Tax=Photobacterium halotolerans TaxID=265726 RepID=UPI00137285FB|nr:hypothetical protein [Photobacterium halotolerans]NAX46555.1 hypothetical protein [Photobacterium halotolerans]
MMKQAVKESTKALLNMLWILHMLDHTVARIRLIKDLMMAVRFYIRNDFPATSTGVVRIKLTWSQKACVNMLSVNGYLFFAMRQEIPVSQPAD